MLSWKKGKWVTGKDIILYLLRELGVSGADYCSLEFGGEIGELSMDDRLTICNMAVEAGAKNGMFPVDEAAKEYLKAVGAPVTEKLEYLREAPDEAYDRVINLDLREVEPMVAFPSKPDNGKRFDEFGEIRIDQVVIGSCTNGRLSDPKAGRGYPAGQEGGRGASGYHHTGYAEDISAGHKSRVYR